MRGTLQPFVAVLVLIRRLYGHRGDSCSVLVLLLAAFGAELKGVIPVQRVVWRCSRRTAVTEAETSWRRASIVRWAPAANTEEQNAPTVRRLENMRLDAPPRDGFSRVRN